jgi:hypothetical protein
MLPAFLLLFAMNYSYAQELIVQGTITDEAKVPIPGASIM